MHGENTYYFPEAPMYQPDDDGTCPDCETAHGHLGPCPGVDHSYACDGSDGQGNQCPLCYGYGTLYCPTCAPVE